MMTIVLVKEFITKLALVSVALCVFAAFTSAPVGAAEPSVTKINEAKLRVSTATKPENTCGAILSGADFTAEAARLIELNRQRSNKLLDEMFTFIEKHGGKNFSNIRQFVEIDFSYRADRSNKLPPYREYRWHIGLDGQYYFKMRLFTWKNPKHVAKSLWRLALNLHEIAIHRSFSPFVKDYWQQQEQWARPASENFLSYVFSGVPKDKTAAWLETLGNVEADLYQLYPSLSEFLSANNRINTIDDNGVLRSALSFCGFSARIPHRLNQHDLASFHQEGPESLRRDLKQRFNKRGWCHWYGDQLRRMALVALLPLNLTYFNDNQDEVFDYAEQVVKFLASSRERPRDEKELIQLLATDRETLNQLLKDRKAEEIEGEYLALREAMLKLPPATTRTPGQKGEYDFLQKEIRRYEEKYPHLRDLP